jgi:cephalosporin hydroxylase
MIRSLVKIIHEYNSERELRHYAPLLNKAAKGLDSVQLVDLLYSTEWERFFWTKQVKPELVEYARLIEQQKPKVAVEIGTNTGGTFFLMCKLSDPTATLISIDLPRGKGGGGYPDYKNNFFKSFGVGLQHLNFIKQDSQDPNTFQRVNEILQGRLIDFLFIDGDHSFQGVKNDFELYSPLVNTGGIIAFHDIKDYPEDHWIKVDRYWKTIRDKYIWKEFKEESEIWGGIGILYKGQL